MALQSIKKKSATSTAFEIEEKDLTVIKSITIKKSVLNRLSQYKQDSNNGMSESKIIQTCLENFLKAEGY